MLCAIVALRFKKMPSEGFLFFMFSPHMHTQHMRASKLHYSLTELVAMTITLLLITTQHEEILFLLDFYFPNHGLEKEQLSKIHSKTFAHLTSFMISQHVRKHQTKCTYKTHTHTDKQSNNVHAEALPWEFVKFSPSKSSLPF